MKLTLLFIYFLASFIDRIFAAIPLDGNVLVLDDENFSEAVSQHPKMLVEFYAPWCGHCKTLAPEWAKAADTLKSSSVKLAKVDATEAKNLAQEYGIKGFPTIKYFNNGKPSDYSGGRTESDIVSFANKKAGPGFQTIASEADLMALQEQHDVSVLGAFKSDDSVNARAFKALADKSDDLHFAVTSSAEILAKLVVKDDTVIVLKSFDDKRADRIVGEVFDEEAMQKFLLAESVPLVQEFSREASSKIFKSPITTHMLLFTNKAEAHHEPSIATIREVAAEYKGNFLFISVPFNPDNKGVFDYFGFKEDTVPAIIIADMNKGGSGMKKFVFPAADKIDTSSVRGFVKNFLAGNLKPTLKSEEPAPEDTAGNVVVLKGKSFNDIVINNSKDVFVEFYAPWCGHCKNLAPVWDELGAKYANNDNLVIAKMDATANEIDVPGIAVQGFPTLYFLKGTDKANAIKYEGDRSLEALAAFLEERVSGSSSASTGSDEL